jgi:hypothetical protein
MNLITDTLRQIVRRKLWPVALLLIGALVAVPLVLAKNPEAEPIAQAANANKVESLPATFVSAADTATAETAKRRRTLGMSKDPFEPAPLPKAKKAKKAAEKDDAKADTTDATPKDDTSSSGGGAAAPGGATTPPVSAAPTPTPAPTVTVPAFSVKVRFGTTESDPLPGSTIERLSVLPDEANPVVVYRGVEDGGKVAIFELTGDVVAEGDGTCAPTPEDCQYVKLRAGETEFITVSDTVTDAGETATPVQYQLDLVKIYKKRTKEKVDDGSADASAQSLAKASSSSLKGKSKRLPLRRRNRYVFDATKGTLHRAPTGAKTPLSTL